VAAVLEKGAVHRARSPKAYVSELLTLSEACERFDIRFQRVWAMAEAGMINPVRYKGRILYVEAQLRKALVK
jgi:hypothetical protein